MEASEVALIAGNLFSAIFLFVSYSMRSMIPLRIVGILTSTTMILISIPSGNYIQLMLHAVLLPLNSFRLYQILKLLRDVKHSVSSDLSMAWLKPFMSERPCKAGDVLFYKDEKADEMFYIVSGKFQLVESGIVHPVGSLVGELGMLSPSNKRTQTLECVESGMVLAVNYTQVEELIVQDPSFGFYFLRLVSARLFENLNRLEAQLAERPLVENSAVATSARS